MLKNENKNNFHRSTGLLDLFCRLLILINGKYNCVFGIMPFIKLNLSLLGLQCQIYRLLTYRFSKCPCGNPLQSSIRTGERKRIIPRELWELSLPENIEDYL